ncbi:hypothetical protein Bca4012_088589 [Brassica carinata]
MRAEAEIGLRSSEAETGTRAGTDAGTRDAIGQRQRQQLRSSMMAEKDEKLSFFLEMRGVRKSMIIFFSTIIMSSDLGMVLYVQSLKLLQCSISQVMVQQERKEMIDPEATFSNEEGDVSEGGEFLEHWKK